MKNKKNSFCVLNKFLSKTFSSKKTKIEYKMRFIIKIVPPAKDVGFYEIFYFCQIIYCVMKNFNFIKQDNNKCI